MSFTGKAGHGSSAPVDKNTEPTKEPIRQNPPIGGQTVGTHAVIISGGGTTSWDYDDHMRHHDQQQRMGRF